MSPPLIKDVIRYTVKSRINIFDVPPGTSCPPVTASYKADYIILVTEPTPFGLHDLELACAMAEELQKPYGVVINRAGGSFTGVEEFCYSQCDFIDLFIENFESALETIVEEAGIVSQEDQS
jgi:MinD superfamily P-loop ATPase